jgi:hypothetical protein
VTSKYVFPNPCLPPYHRQIYIDVPQENILLNANAVGSTASSSTAKPSSPATPKRPRVDVGLTDDTFDDISPIASPRLPSPHTTPKRRRSHAPGGRSLLDLFSSLREEDASMRPSSRRPNLSMSVDFTNMRMEDDSSDQPSTPVAVRKRVPITPCAPRKLSRSCPNLVLREEELPGVPRRLDFGPPTLTTPPSSPDYGSIMSIVGYVSSYLIRTGRFDVPLMDLVEMIQSSSSHYKSYESAEAVLKGLALAAPEWIRTDGGMYHFETSIKSYEVLKKLRQLKRNRDLEL